MSDKSSSAKWSFVWFILFFGLLLALGTVLAIVHPDDRGLYQENNHVNRP